MRGAAASLSSLALAAALLSGCAGAEAPVQVSASGKPQRIMSMNMCVDMLVLQLVEKERITSVTYLAERGMRDIDPALARGVPRNHGTTEEILAQQPDLILAGDFSTAMTREVAARAGAPIIEVKSAVTFDDIRQITRQVGEAVGEPERAQALVDEMDAALARLESSSPAAPYEVVVWNGESVPGRQTLASQIVHAAGAENLGARNNDGLYATFGLEELLSADPDYMLYADDGADEPSVLGAAMTHKALQTRYGDRMIGFPESLFRCGVPQSATAAAQLRAALEAAS